MNETVHRYNTRRKKTSMLTGNSGDFEGAREGQLNVNICIFHEGLHVNS
jgi:hypothetical protein